MRALISGVGGFAGRHLAAHLAGRHELWGLSRHEAEVPGVRLLVADLLDEPATRRVVAEAQPDVVFHLAAASSPADSLHDPVGTLRDNVLGTASLLQALLGSGSRARVLLVTSSEIYGLPSDCPLTEDSAPAPRSAYGVSKLAVHELGRQVYRTDGLEIIEARPFNHIGPGQGLGFVVPDFAAQIAGIKLGQREPLLRVGDLSAARDFSDVRDIVRGYEALALGGQAGEVYHLCSGIGRPIQAVVDTLCALAQVAPRIERDPERQRPGPGGAVVGSAERARQAVSWQPRIPFEQTLAEVLDEWLTRLASR